MLIAPFKSGLTTETEPWISPPDAFPDLRNFHVTHGRLEKRRGYRVFGTLPSNDRVMGLARYFDTEEFNENLAFDTTSAYRFNSSTNVYDQLDPIQIFSGGQKDFVVSANWQSQNLPNRLYFTNGLAWNGLSDPNSRNGIRFYNGSPSTQLLIPDLGGATLYGCKLIFTLNQRLVVLSTAELEGPNVNYHPQRARWCAKQNPELWSDIVAGQGDFADASTGEHIISAVPKKNSLIVFFSNSVWELVPTGDPNRAFQWKRLNNFRSCDGRQASVGFDDMAISIGTTGIIATNSNGSQRIDDKISNFVTDEVDKGSFDKMFCFRDFQNLRFLTLYANNSSENNKVLVNDDDSRAFSKYDLSLTCLGYANTSLSLRISDFPAGVKISDFGNMKISDFSWQENADILIGGTVDGRVLELNFGAYDGEEPIPCSFITSAWNPYKEDGLEAKLLYVDFLVTTVENAQGVVYFFKDSETAPYKEQFIDLLPNLGYICNITGIQNTDPCLITAPDHGLDLGGIVYVYGVRGVGIGGGYDFVVMDENTLSLVGVDGTNLGEYKSGGKLYERAYRKEKAWIRAFAGGVGSRHQISATFNALNDQIIIHALKPVFSPVGKERLIN